MNTPRICAVITDSNLKSLKQAEPLVDLFELRIDFVGEGWPEVAREIRKPWIACNRPAEEGGRWSGNETRRIEQLLRGIELGASMIDIELRAINLVSIVQAVKKRAQCIISYHDPQNTPPFEEVKDLVRQEIEAGADIAKVVTTARAVEDNLTVLRLLSQFPGHRLVAFAMGPLGVLSRVLCPLAGADFTYASLEKGKESAQGQPIIVELASIYEMIAL